MNIGPFGMSEYHDTHPQILSICSINNDGIIEDCIHISKKSNFTIENEDKDDDYDD